MIIEHGEKKIELNDKETDFFVQLLEDNLNFLNESLDLMSCKGDEELEETFPEDMLEGTDGMYIIKELPEYKDMFNKLSNIIKVPQKLKN